MIPRKDTLRSNELQDWLSPDKVPLYVPRRNGKKFYVKPGGVSYIRITEGSPSFRYIVFLKEKPTERIYLNNPREVRRFTDKVGTEALDSIWRETDFLRRDGARRIFLVWSSYKLRTGGSEDRASSRCPHLSPHVHQERNS